MNQQLVMVNCNSSMDHAFIASSIVIGLGESKCNTSSLRVAKYSLVNLAKSQPAVSSSSFHAGSQTHCFINVNAPHPMKALISDHAGLSPSGKRPVGVELGGCTGANGLGSLPPRLIATPHACGSSAGISWMQ